jgi:hypothetical protein
VLGVEPATVAGVAHRGASFFASHMRPPSSRIRPITPRTSIYGCGTGA